MSRSYRHTPISSVCGVVSGQKLFRSLENRAFRHKVKQFLVADRDEPLPDEREYGNEWASPRDGKMWFGDLNSVRYRCWVCRDPGMIARYGFRKKHQCVCYEYKKEYKELMRK